VEYFSNAISRHWSSATNTAAGEFANSFVVLWFGTPEHHVLQKNLLLSGGATYDATSISRAYGSQLPRMAHSDVTSYAVADYVS